LTCGIYVGGSANGAFAYNGISGSWKETLSSDEHLTQSNMVLDLVQPFVLGGIIGVIVVAIGVVIALVKRKRIHGSDTRVYRDSL